MIIKKKIRIVRMIKEKKKKKENLIEIRTVKEIIPKDFISA